MVLPSSALHLPSSPLLTPNVYVGKQITVYSSPLGALRNTYPTSTLKVLAYRAKRNQSNPPNSEPPAPIADTSPSNNDQMMPSFDLFDEEHYSNHINDVCSYVTPSSVPRQGPAFYPICNSDAASTNQVN